MLFIFGTNRHEIRTAAAVIVIVETDWFTHRNIHNITSEKTKRP